MCNQNQFFFGKFGVLLRQSAEFLRAVENKRGALAAAAEALHLRVRFVAGNEQHRVGRRVPLHNAVDLEHIGTGGVHIVDAAAFEQVENLLRHPVGADDHLRAGQGVLRLFQDGDAPLPQVVDHLRVVDDGAERADRRSPFHKVIEHGHGAVHAVAEAGRFGKRHGCRHADPFLQRGIFSRMVRVTSSTDCSSVLPLVSSRMASSAGFSGAMARWLSL